MLCIPCLATAYLEPLKCISCERHVQVDISHIVTGEAPNYCTCDIKNRL